jgi:hypothetical protein
MIKTFLVGLLAVAAATVEQYPAPQQTKEPPSIHQYGDVDAACEQWTDLCRACGRGSDGAPVCSNIGIACQPKAVVCTARKAAPAK